MRVDQPDLAPLRLPRPGQGLDDARELGVRADEYLPHDQVGPQVGEGDGGGAAGRGRRGSIPGGRSAVHVARDVPSPASGVAPPVTAGGTMEVVRAPIRRGRWRRSAPATATPASSPWRQEGSRRSGRRSCAPADRAHGRGGGDPRHPMRPWPGDRSSGGAGVGGGLFGQPAGDGGHRVAAPSRATERGLKAGYRGAGR